MAAAGLASRILWVGCLAYLLLFATLAVSSSLGDKRNGPIRLRENLWATGHFMGKKSAPDSARLQPLPAESAELNRIPGAFSPFLTGVLEDMKDLLTRELLRNLLQRRLLEENQEDRDLKDQEIPSLMKLLAKYT